MHLKGYKTVKKPTILLVDDEEAIIKSLSGSLEDEGYSLLTAQDGAAAMEIVKTQPVDMVFLDIWLPSMDGLETLKAMKEYDPSLEIIMMTGHGTVNTAVQAVKLGALDFLEKPFSLDTALDIIKKVQEKRQISMKTMRYYESIKPDRRKVLIGDSADAIAIRDLVTACAASSAHILLQGENGTGKELVARLIHFSSSRQESPLLKFNCATFNSDEIERELFGVDDAGHAGMRKEGVLDRARQGTVFLKAIDLMPLSAQSRLARYMRNSEQEGSVPRIIASSIKNITVECREGRLLRELLDCFNAEVLRMPKLRNRSGDISVLLKYFLKFFCDEYGQQEKRFEDEAFETLVNYDWPGNVKELKNMVEKIVVSVPTKSITVNDLPQTFRREMENGAEQQFMRYETMQDAEDAWRKNYLVYHLRRNNRNIAQTAQQLSIAEDTLRSYIRKYGITLISGRRREHMYQRTLRRSMVLSGRGLHSGIKTGLILSPLPPNSGIVFGNISDGSTIPAHLDFVESTEYATSLKKGNARASTIEHVLATLHAYRVTNLLIKINTEVPIMDGSAAEFCQLLEDAGLEEQDSEMDEITITDRYIIGDVDADKKHMIVEPCDTLTIHYTLHYPAPVGHQEYTFVLENAQSFKEQIAPARTFGFLKDIEALEKKGLASGGRLNNFILIDDEKIINTELRFPDEFVRHKILDLMGDLYLLGHPVRGKITAHMTGHTQNCEMLRLLRTAIQLN
jgi:two-component system nitrogen regulation response regulator NtrX